MMEWLADKEVLLGTMVIALPAVVLALLPIWI